jgi:hypothetical protein
MGIFPVIFLYQNGMYWTSFFLFLSFFFSVIYHMDETNFTALLFDVSGCTVLLSCLFYLLKNARYVFTGMNCLSTVMLSAALFCFISAGDDTQSERYSIYHAAWHVFSVYGVSAFVYSFVHSHADTKSVMSRPIYPAMRRFVPAYVRGSFLVRCLPQSWRGSMCSSEPIVFVPVENA